MNQLSAYLPIEFSKAPGHILVPLLEAIDMRDEAEVGRHFLRAMDWLKDVMDRSDELESSLRQRRVTGCPAPRVVAPSDPDYGSVGADYEAPTLYRFERVSIPGYLENSGEAFYRKVPLTGEPR